MTPANKNLLVRVVSAVVLIPLVLWMIWYSPVTTGAFLAIAAGAIAYELSTMGGRPLHPTSALGVLVAIALPLGWVLVPERFPALALGVLAALTVAAFILTLLFSAIEEAPGRIGRALVGPLYGGLLLAPIAGLRLLVPNGVAWVATLLIVTWLNDTGAYFAGRALGRHKLFPSVSPNKTWEGFFGGMAVSVIGALVASLTFFPALSPVHAVAVAIPASVLGPLGDLSESMLKRAFGVKDSGRLIPGHGGVLDRLDALLFTAPYVWLFAWLAGI